MNQVENQVDVAYHNLLQSRRLVEAYLAGVLDDARSTFTIVERAYERGGATILDLLDAARTSRTIQQNFIEASVFLPAQPVSAGKFGRAGG